MTNSPSWSRRPVPLRATTALIGLVLLSYTAIRAHRIAFTHDECGTFFTYVTASFWDILTFHVVDANNHPLNSLLERVCYLVLGDHPLYLRLPNLFAHAVYLVFAYRAVRLVQPNALVGIAGFLLLTANPYVLDFFGLARGYGLSLGLVMASMYHAGRHAHTRLRSDVWRASIWGGLAVMGNLTALPAWVAMALVANAWWIKDLATAPRPSGGFAAALLARNLPFLAVGSALSVLLGWSSYRLGRAHAFYVGGKTGFWHDTVLGLADATLYAPATAVVVHSVAWAGALAFVLAAIALAVGRGAAAEQPGRPAGLVWCPVFALTAGSTFAVHAVLGVHLSGRTALVLWPLFVLSLIGGLQAGGPRRAPRRVLAAITVVAGFALAAHCLRVANTRYTRDWRFDAAASDAVLALERAVGEDVGAGGREVRLGAHWWYVPSLRFHARRRGLTWLAPLRREERLFSDPFDYYYLGSVHTSRLANTRTEVVAEFALSGTVLLRRLP